MFQAATLTALFPMKDIVAELLFTLKSALGPNMMQSAPPVHLCR